MTRLTLALSLALPLVLIACGDKDEEEEEVGPIDNDGDGSFADEDCDDNDPTAYPGNTETWYDGIDGDCGSDDDYDADADGVRSEEHGGGDCDDADDTVFPGATEVWYDGVDQDCAGDNDNDADVDGFDGLDGGGDDCDDNDDTIYPAASDTWYDGVDSDCAGDSDYDADADGFDSDDHGGTDCDDTDGDINPDATETWYDGVDADCADDDDYDADADGTQSDEHGGNDCDDNDGGVAYGNAEKLDGKDTDCDGTADSYSIDGDWGGSSITGTDQDGAFGLPLVVLDYDQDGIDDVLTSTPFTEVPTLYFFNGTTVAAGSTSQGNADASLEAYSIVTNMDLFEDLDGTGTAYLSASEPLIQDFGAVYLLTWAELSSATVVTEASRAIYGDDSTVEFGFNHANAGDLDGDGTPDLIVSGTDDWLHIFSGATLGATAGVWSSADATAAMHASDDFSNDWGPGNLVSLGDLDGDGYGEVLIGQPHYNDHSGRVIILEGELNLQSDDIDNLLWASIEGDSTDDEVGFSVSTGDVDADGIPDIIIGAPGQDSQGGRAHAVLGADLTSGTHSLSTVSHVSYTGATVFGQAGHSVASGYDIDGDGADDIAVGGPEDSAGGDEAGEAYLIMSGQSGSRALADAAVRFTGSSTEDSTGAAVGLGDFNGDGLGDAVFSAPGKDDTLGNEGVVYVGFSGY